MGKDDKIDDDIVIDKEAAHGWMGSSEGGKKDRGDSIVDNKAAYGWWMGSSGGGKKT